MRILLSDGSGLTARQAATQASHAGHEVEVVSPTRIGLSGFTRHVRRVHRVPTFGRDPWGWLKATLAVLEAGGHDVLLPTQEQVALLAREADRIRALGVGLAVPPFRSLRRVQDKVAQSKTLADFELPHPPTAIAHSVEELFDLTEPPAYLKTPIGTASVGVEKVSGQEGLQSAAARFAGEGSFRDGGVVVQRALAGPLVMVQAVYASGRLLTWHASERLRQGMNGGASIKRGTTIPAIGEHLERLGAGLGWNGALALDAILTAEGPNYIDINPRLVEPGNAWRSGVDLVDVLIRVSLDETPAPCPPARRGVTTRQLLIAVLGAAERRGRRGVAREILQAMIGHGTYAGSAEELTPVRGDVAGALPLIAATVATLAIPSTAQALANGAVANYAITPDAWQRILA